MLRSIPFYILKPHRYIIGTLPSLSYNLSTPEKFNPIPHFYCFTCHTFNFIFHSSLCSINKSKAFFSVQSFAGFRRNYIISYSFFLRNGSHRQLCNIVLHRFRIYCVNGLSFILSALLSFKILIIVITSTP